MDLPFLKKPGQPPGIPTIEMLSEEELYEKTRVTLKDIVTPVGLEIKSAYLKFSDYLVKSLFILSY